MVKTTEILLLWERENDYWEAVRVFCYIIYHEKQVNKSENVVCFRCSAASSERFLRGVAIAFQILMDGVVREGHFRPRECCMHEYGNIFHSRNWNTLILWPRIHSYMTIVGEKTVINSNYEWPWMSCLKNLFFGNCDIIKKIVCLSLTWLDCVLNLIGRTGWISDY